MGLFPNQVKVLLQEHGFSYEAATSAWAENGWITTSKGRNTFKISVEGFKHWMIVVPRDHLGEQE